MLAAWEADLEKGVGRAITFSFAASSLAARQVNEGAPADVLITADAPSMDIARRAQTVGRPTVLARNRLELVVAKGNPIRISGLSDLARPDLTVVLCEAEVPCGRLSSQLLFEVGVSPNVDSFEPDVGAAVGKVVIGEADVTIAYRSDVVARTDLVEGIAIEAAADPRLGAEYLAAVVNDSPNRAGARRLISVLASPPGLERLKAAGFEAPGEAR